MNKKREFACNKLFNCCFIVGLLLIWAAVDCFIYGAPEDIGWAWGLLAAALLFIIIPAIFTPVFYAFDKEGVSLCYVFFPAERYLWKDIRSIKVDDAVDDMNGKELIIGIFFIKVFHLEGKPVGDTKFFMKGNIRKSFRTKRLLEKYWDGQITGCFFEGISRWFSKRRKKKQMETKQHLTDEIMPMEREVRAKAREWLKPFTAKAKLCGLELKADYIYVTEDFKEFKSRPEEGYTYTLVVEIAYPNEKDEDRIVCVSIDMLHVRLGKTAYRGVESPCAYEETAETLGSLFDEIKEKGIEAYLENE